MRRILLWLLSFFPVPEEPKPQVFVPKGLPPSFYLRLTQPEEAPNLEMKRALIRLVQNEDWHWYEQYLGWKMGVATREAMQATDDRIARDRRVEVGAWSENTQDLVQYWLDIKVEEGKTKKERDEEKKRDNTFDSL